MKIQTCLGPMDLKYLTANLESKTFVKCLWLPKQETKDLGKENHWLDLGVKNDQKSMENL